MPLRPIEGIVAVMLTVFHEDGQIDYAAMDRLIDWYLKHQVDVLFTVCQSSEMVALTMGERIELAKFVGAKVRGRLPVIVSGHVADDRGAQLEELTAMYDTGADAIVLVSSRLDPKNEGESTFHENLDWLLERLPSNINLGLYECPAPYRRVLSDSELMRCASSGRFTVLKDVSCDLATVRRRVKLTQETPLTIINANGAIALEAMQAGCGGYSGVFNNIHPELYAWIYRHWREYPQLAKEVSVFLVAASVSELMGYPALAKLWHRKLGTFDSIKCRVIDYDLYEKFWWGLDEILDKLYAGTQFYNERIKSAMLTGE